MLYIQSVFFILSLHLVLTGSRDQYWVVNVERLPKVHLETETIIMFRADLEIVIEIRITFL